MSAGVVSTVQRSNVRPPLAPSESAHSLDSASAVFDRIAERYDEIFTHTLIGRLQRQVVWDVLASTFVKGQRVLEINCGTGEDALFLGARGVLVTACDASAGMIEVAQRRKLQDESDGAVEFRVLANEKLMELPGKRFFDGACSNFSGLNCVEDIAQIAEALGTLLQPAARLVICMSTRVCAWEMVWYLARGRVRRAFRRIPGHTIASVEGSAVPVWYPTLRQIRKQFAPWFRVRSVRAVGLFVPPSYAEGWAQRHKHVVSACGKLDRLLGRLPILRVLGDHMVLELERTQT
jgi:ubiquinone/menaquinone biosynthesis C-methylase UbiE